jgi:hypothetical protein
MERAICGVIVRFEDLLLRGANVAPIPPFLSPKMEMVWAI